MAVSAELRRRIRDEIPAFAWLVDVPEVGDLLGRAVSEGWDITKLQGQLYATRWWRSQSETQRNWKTLSATDPGEAQRQRRDMAAQARAEAGRLGVQLSNAEAAYIGEQALQNGWDSAAIGRSIAGWAQRTGKIGRTGAVQSTWQELRAWSEQMGIAYPSNKMRDWSIKISTGQASLEGVKAGITEMAKDRYGRNATINRVLKSGGTVWDAMAPTIGRLAEELEMDPNRFSLTSGRGAQLLNYVDPSTGERRVMEDYEVTRFARNQPEWKRTRGARNLATETAGALTAFMGRRAG